MAASDFSKTGCNLDTAHLTDQEGTDDWYDYFLNQIQGENLQRKFAFVVATYYENETANESEQPAVYWDSVWLVMEDDSGKWKVDRCLGLIP